VFRQVQRIDHPVALELDRFEQARVMGDADRLRQVIFNLMNNAIKYTPEGGEVHVSLARDEDEAVITVADTGMGIPPEDLPHIFDRFYRVDKARTRPRGGFGLGLSIVKWIVEAHQGTVDVESHMGEGTTFSVRLPLLPDDLYMRSRDDSREQARRERSTAQ
jgi:two-component system phosphate regulon sensor histidine kinase PhoR